MRVAGIRRRNKRALGGLRLAHDHRARRLQARHRRGIGLGPPSLVRRHTVFGRKVGGVYDVFQANAGAGQCSLFRRAINGAGDLPGVVVVAPTPGVHITIPLVDTGQGGVRFGQGAGFARADGSGDFRRTAARNFTRAQVSESVAMAITGHKTNSMFRRYNITNMDDKRNAFIAAEEHLESQKHVPTKVSLVKE